MKHCTAVPALVMKVENNDDGTNETDGAQADGSAGQKKPVSTFAILIHTLPSFLSQPI